MLNRLSKTIFLVTTFCVVGFTTIPENDGIIGIYYKSFGYSSISIELKKDGDYIEIFSGCTSDLFYEGTWELRSDTLILCRRSQGTLRPSNSWPYFDDFPTNLILKENKIIYPEEQMEGKLISDRTLVKQETKVEVVKKRARRKSK